MGLIVKSMCFFLRSYKFKIKRGRVMYALVNLAVNSLRSCGSFVSQIRGSHTPIWCLGGPLSTNKRVSYTNVGSKSIVPQANNLIHKFNVKLDHDLKIK